MLKAIFSIHNKIRFCATKIIYQNITNINCGENFQYKILSYFEKTLANEKPLELYKPSKLCRDESFKFNNGINLESLYSEIQRISNIKDEEIYMTCISDFDLNFFVIINHLTYLEILKILNTFLKLLPNDKIVSTYIYEKCLLMLIQATQDGLLNNHEIIQLLFFISLRKKYSKEYVNSLKPYLPNIDKLNLFEKCIIATVFHNTSNTLPSHYLESFEKSMEKDCDELISNSDLLKPIYEAIKHVGLSKQCNLQNISNAILDSKRLLNFTTITCLLELYKDNLIHESNVINLLIKEAIEIIKQDLTNSKFELNLREVDSFLWSIVYLGIILSLNEKLIIRTYVEKLFDVYYRKENLDILISNILCLHILRCWSMKIINICVNNNIFQEVYDGEFHWKVRLRLHLLISQIKLEMKYKVPNELNRKWYTKYKKSDNINLIDGVCFKLVKEGLLNAAKVECPIRSLIIPGITLITGQNKYHVDVLDNISCLKNTNTPHGLMNFKLRLLSQMRYQNIMINGSIFNENPTQVLSKIEHQIVSQIVYGQSWNLHHDVTKENV